MAISDSLKILGTVVGLVLIFAACDKNHLPNGVKISWMSGGYYDLTVVRNGIEVEIVPADVQWAKAKGLLIYGFIREHKYADGISSKPGYFVLDTSSWILVDGLSLEEASSLIGEKL